MPSNLLRFAASAWLLSLSLVGNAHAQEHVQGPRGFCASVGIGGGSSLLSCPICTDERQTGIAGQVRAGTALSPFLLTGIELVGQRASLEEGTQRVASAFLIAIGYPREDSGLYVKAGVGASRFEARPHEEPGDDEAVDDVADTYGLTFGVGYDYPLRSGYALSPYLNLVATSFGTLRRSNAALARDLNVSMLQFGLAATVH
jgi:hypothetical protein